MSRRIPAAGPALALAVLLVAACTTGGTASASPSAHATPSPSAAASPTPTPTPSPAGPPVPTYAAAAAHCTAPIPDHGSLAVIHLGASAPAVVADVTNPASPLTLCTLSGGSGWRFIDRTHLSYTAQQTSDIDSPGGIFELNLTTGVASVLISEPAVGFGGGYHNWSPDGRSLTYVLSDSVGVQWHLLNASGDRLLASFGPVPGRGGSPDDDLYAGFSNDGTMVALDSTFFTASGSGSTVQVRRLDGTLVYSGTAGTMGAWQNPGFYFRMDDGVHLVSGSTSSLAISGVKWRQPSASPDGEDFAFTADDSSGLPHAWTYGHNGRSGGELNGVRSGATWITSTVLWDAEYRACTASDNCAFTSVIATGNHFLFDGSAETATAISEVDAIYPWSSR